MNMALIRANKLIGYTAHRQIISSVIVDMKYYMYTPLLHVYTCSVIVDMYTHVVDMYVVDTCSVIVDMKYYMYTPMHCSISHLQRWLLASFRLV